MLSRVSLIAAIDEKGGMGNKNQLLCHLPADLAHFKALTLGKPIIMGRRTFDSIGRALPGRLNIVLSRQALKAPGVEVVSSIEKALEMTAMSPEVMIIGGAGVFQQMMSQADHLYLTRIHHQFEADVFFPEVQWESWALHKSIKHAHDEKNPYDMTFYEYEHVKKGNKSEKRS
jgi:dihydrofolate reductase